MIGTRTHALLDYATGLLLLAAPYLFGFDTGGVPQGLTQFLGGLTIAMSLFTDYELSLARVIPLRVHLGMDMTSGAVLAASPWLLGFADVVWLPHLLVGLVELIVPPLTRRPPEGIS